MTANTLPATGLTLGGFLRDRRARLAPGPLALSRRRTPGLRREEVAARADVSVTWYTWLEQGRGGPPSDDVLERLSDALELDAAGREILFLLAQQRPPPIKPATCVPIAPALQRVLDSLSPSPAFLRTPAWDVLAWNDAATAVLANYAELPFRDRNGLRRLFCDPDVRPTLPDWEDNARFVVAVFRVEVARSGSSPEAVALADELHARSPDFRRFWAENDVRSHGVGLKRIVHRTAGMLHFEFSAFSVDGGDGLSMIVYTPARPADVLAVEALLASRARA